jgi:beta-glucosidase
MIKNDGVIKQGGNGKDKPTVYVPYVYNDGYSVSTFNGVSEGTGSWAPGVDTEILGNYFNIVTDTLGDPTGPEDADGNKTHTKDDLTRAKAEDIKDCDYVLVGMTSPYTMCRNERFAGFWQQIDEKDLIPEDQDKWYPASIQYAPYTAENVEEKSVEGWTLSDGSKENRSYKGNTSRIDPNYGHLEALEYANSIAGDIPVVVSMNLNRSMVWSEVEPLADAILVCPAKQLPESVANIMLGKVEPSGLLFIQQAASMEAAEKQLNDVPRDMECYVDADGNKYDFGFGMNWSGVIKDARTAKYADAAPLTKVSSFDYSSFEAANKKH